MPAFIKKYWGLDKSLPNYPVACPTMRTYHPILNTANASLTRAQDFYVKLSQNQGRLGSSVEDCLSQFSNLRQEFEKDAQACLKEVFLIDIHKWKKLNQQKSLDS